MERRSASASPPPPKFWMVTEHVLAPNLYTHELSGDPDQYRSPKRGHIVAVPNLCMNKPTKLKKNIKQLHGPATSLTESVTKIGNSLTDVSIYVSKS